MKALILLASVAAVSASVDYASLWADWKVRYNRTYSAKEDSERFFNFKVNHRHVQNMNALGGASYTLNKFSDRSVFELKGLRGTRVSRELRESYPKAAKLSTVNLTDVDWRSQGYVSPIQDQGQCGSCWAFSATSNIESVAAIANSQSPPTKLAEQYLVDCDHTCGTYRSESGCDSGCNGGLQPNAFQYVIANGQPTESSYPYQGVAGQCQSGNPSAVTISNWQMVSEDESQIAAFLQATGPVSIAVDASQWSFYSGGVMSPSVCPNPTGYSDLDHGVNIVGFGTQNGQDVWIVRNSWSTDWGIAGYAYVPRGVGFCGIQLFACSSTA